MKINNLTPNQNISFGDGRFTRAATNVVDTSNDRGNTVASTTGGVSAAVIGAKKVTNVFSRGKNIANAASVAQQANKNAFEELMGNLGKAFESSRLTSWGAKFLKTPFAKKTGGLLGTASAFTVVIASLCGIDSLRLPKASSYLTPLMDDEYCYNC